MSEEEKQSDSTLERRMARYAATGPLCPNGHEWSKHARFTYKKYRFCGACTEEKRELRRSDPRTYSGSCQNGHPRTRENTFITNWNTLFCKTCAAQRHQTGTFRIPKERIALVLERAKQGIKADVIIGRKGARKMDGIDPIISSNTLRKIYVTDTPECREITRLLKLNSKTKAARVWLPDVKEALSENVTKRLSVPQITTSLNHRFGTNFSPSAVAAKAYKLGMSLDGLAPRAIRSLEFMPTLTGVIAAQPHEIYTAIDRAVPRQMDIDRRQEAMQEMMLAVLEGRLTLDEAPRRFREFITIANRALPSSFARGDIRSPLSLDAPIFADSTMTRGEMVSEGLW